MDREKHRMKITMKKLFRDPPGRCLPNIKMSTFWQTLAQLLSLLSLYFFSPAIRSFLDIRINTKYFSSLLN